MCYHDYQPTYSDYVDLTRADPIVWLDGIPEDNKPKGSWAVPSWDAFDNTVRLASDRLIPTVDEPFSQVSIAEGTNLLWLHYIPHADATRFGISDGESSISWKAERLFGQ